MIHKVISIKSRKIRSKIPEFNCEQTIWSCSVPLSSSS